MAVVLNTVLLSKEPLLLNETEEFYTMGSSLNFKQIIRVLQQPKLLRSLYVCRSDSCICLYVFQREICLSPLFNNGCEKQCVSLF